MWHRVEGTSQRAIYEHVAGGQRATLSISEQPLGPLPEGKTFLQFAEEQQEATLSKLERVSVHYNSTRKMGAPCLAYDGIYKDKADQVLPFLTFRGQLCRHPDIAGKMIQVEVAQRSGTKDDAYKVDLLELSEKVFSGVVTGLPKQSQSDR
jgi:hypothetical protein